MSDRIENWLPKRNNTIDTLNKLIGDVEGTLNVVHGINVLSNVGSVVSGLCTVSAVFTGGLSAVAGSVARRLVSVNILSSYGSTIYEHYNISTALKNAQKAIEADYLETLIMKEKWNCFESIASKTAKSGISKLGKKVAVNFTYTTTKRKATKKATDEAKSRACKQTIAVPVVGILFLTKNIYDLFYLVKTGAQSAHWLIQELRNIVTQLIEERDCIVALSGK